FEDFSTKLPPRIPLDSASNDSAVISILREAGLDFDDLRDKDRDERDRVRVLFLDRAEDTINETLRNYLDGVKLAARAEGDELFFWIRDELSNKVFKPQERSKGSQWLLGCYLELCSRQNEIILIDEPALYLHPKAQGTVLKLFGKALERGMQIIYSTHSPFLIDPDMLGR